MAQPAFQAEVFPDPASLADPGLAVLLELWRQKRGDRAMPARADISPSDLRKYLDSVTMLEVIDGGAEFRYRLVGTALTQYFLQDPTGKTLSQAWPDDAIEIRERLHSNLNMIVTLRAPAYATGKLDWPGFPSEPFEILWVPLSDDGETVNMIINMFKFERARVLTNRQIAREQGRTKLLFP